LVRDADTLDLDLDRDLVTGLEGAASVSPGVSPPASTRQHLG